MPDGYTVNGAGHVITAHDPGTGPSGVFEGPVVTNAGATMTLKNLTVRGTGFAYGCNNENPTAGILFLNASRAMTNVKVLDITQHSACLTVHAIIIRSETTQQAVNLASVTAARFQRTGLLVMGMATVHVTGSTFGPPDLTVPNPGRLAQNSVQIGSPALAGPTGGTFTGNNVTGTAFGTAANVSTAMLLANATGLTVSRNTFHGADTDAGIALSGVHDVVISCNKIDRGAPDRAGFDDPYGYGISADSPSRPQTTLICNTFSGWNLNLEDITQPPCIQTRTLHPCATVHQPYSHKLQAINADPAVTLTWDVISGKLPPGLRRRPGSRTRLSATTR